MIPDLLLLFVFKVVAAIRLENVPGFGIKGYHSVWHLSPLKELGKEKRKLLFSEVSIHTNQVYIPNAMQSNYYFEVLANINRLNIIEYSLFIFDMNQRLRLCIKESIRNDIFISHEEDYYDIR